MSRSCLVSLGVMGLVVMGFWGSAPVMAADGTWTNNGSGNWSDTTKWDGGSVAGGSGFTAYFTGPAGITADRTITNDGTRTVGNLTFTDLNGALNTWTITGANPLILDNGGSSLISLATPATINSVLDGGGSVVLDGGTNTLRLGVNNTLSGTFTVRSGGLYLTSTNALAATSRLILADASTGANDVWLTFGNFNLNVPHGITLSDQGTGGAKIVWATANGVWINGPMELGRTIEIYVNAGSLTIGGKVSGAGGIVKSGGSTLALGMTSAYADTHNDYSGSTIIREGGLIAYNSTAFGSTSVQLGDELTGNTGVALYLSKGPTVNRNILVYDTGGTGNATIGNDINTSAYGTHAGIYSGNITLQRSVMLKELSSSTLTISGHIDGVGDVASAQGSVVLNASNSYTGDTTVVAGTLTVNAAASLGTGDVTVNTNALLKLNGSVAIQDEASLYLAKNGATYGKIELAGSVNERVGALFLDGVRQSMGTYGSTSSGATTLKDDNYFSVAGTGMLTVLPPKGTVISIR